MESNYNNISIRPLLQKYWEGNTSLDEERDIKEFFLYAPVPSDLVDEAAYFRSMIEVPEDVLGDDFDLEVLQKTGIENKGGAKVFSIAPQSSMYRAAAAAVIIGVCGWFIWSNLGDYQNDQLLSEENSQNQQEIEEAFTQTKQALFLLSSKFNRGNSEVVKLKKFDEAREQVKTISNE
jgi:hypothetical protein